jgi:two-component system chemotaxis sensor kinase CheA
MEVFLFVENDSELKVEKICDYNLVAAQESKDFIKRLSEFDTDELIDLPELKKLIIATPEQAEINLTKNETLEDSSRVKEKNISSIRVASIKLDALMSIVSELVTTQAGLSLFAEKNSSPELEIITENIEKLSRQLRDVAFGMTLIPIKTIMGRFQRLVRDVADDLGKTINFKIEGDETELDKNIIESLTDPLMHILRNSLDHGIENGKVRTENGKPEAGNILFRAFYSGANVYLEIKDDGKGIDPAIIKAKAISKGIIHEDANLSEKEILELIFYPGFSTAKKITDVSGRGVGMDVVQRNIENLRGEVEISSLINQGTTITIKLPLTLSIIDGLLVVIGNVSYVLPLAVVDKCYEVEYAKLENNFNKVLILDGLQIPFLNLRDEFVVKEDKPEVSQIIVVHKGERKVGITIDDIVGEYQAVLKPIGKYYKNQDYISGATILGDGTIALVLDTNKIINRFANTIESQV